MRRSLQSPSTSLRVGRDAGFVGTCPLSTINCSRWSAVFQIQLLLIQHYLTDAVFPFRKGAGVPGNLHQNPVRDHNLKQGMVQSFRNRKSGPNVWKIQSSSRFWWVILVYDCIIAEAGENCNNKKHEKVLFPLRSR